MCAKLLPLLMRNKVVAPKRCRPSLQVRKYVINKHPIPNQTQEKQLEDTQIAIGSRVAFGIEMEIKHVQATITNSVCEQESQLLCVPIEKEIEI